MLWGYTVGRRAGAVQALEKAARFPREVAGRLLSPTQLHLVLPFSFFTYAETADSSGDLYQIQMLKNNLLNTFLDKLKSKTFLSLVQPSLKGQAGLKVTLFPS